jgi:hypothetical protein
MSLNLNANFMEDLRRRAGEYLLAIAEDIVHDELQEWQKGPPRSLPGEHLRIDTGQARDSLIFTPDDPVEAGTNGVRIGYRKRAWYAPWWEQQPAHKRRRGLIDKFGEYVAEGRIKGITWRIGQ